MVGDGPAPRIRSRGQSLQCPSSDWGPWATGWLADRGVPLRQRLGVPDQTPANSAAFEEIALKYRTALVNEAVGETRKALEWPKPAGAIRFSGIAVQPSRQCQRATLGLWPRRWWPISEQIRRCFARRFQRMLVRSLRGLCLRGRQPRADNHLLVRISNALEIEPADLISSQMSDDYSQLFDAVGQLDRRDQVRRPHLPKHC